MSLEFEIPLVSFIFILILNIVYFTKKRIDLVENRPYKFILVCSLVVSFIDTIIHFICAIYPFNVLSTDFYSLFNFLNKILSSMFVIIFSSLFCYTLMISYNYVKQNYKKVVSFLTVVNIIFIFTVLFTDIDIIDAGLVTNVSGLTIILGYIMVALFLIASLVISLINIKKIDKRYLPIFLVFLILTCLYFITLFFPGMIIYDLVLALMCYIMYFTIENPDAQILEEIHNAKLISDNANEEKSMFLYNISNEIKQIISDISISNNNILEEVDKKKPNLSLIDNSASEINSFITKFDTMINEVYDISQVDVNNIKIYKDKYNIKIIIKELVQKYSKKAQSKSLDFRSKIASDVPDYLYGDSVTLKKVINIILDNSYKNTTSGYIEFNVDTIFKNNICRLVISIEDSGIGMRAGELNYALNKESDVKDSELADTLFNAKKMITLMGGTLIVNSIYGKGTKIKIVLDQKVEKIDSKLDKYVQIYDKKKLLLVDDSDASCKIISKMLDDTNVVLDIVKSGKEALDKIRSKEKYDLILLDEDMHPLNGIEVMNKFMEIKNFNIDVVLLTRNNNYEYNEDYLKYGFSNYLLKPIDKEKLFEVISKK